MTVNPPHAIRMVHNTRVAHASADTVVVIGTPALAALYVRAIGDRAVLGDSDAAVHGLALIGARVTWTT